MRGLLLALGLSAGLITCAIVFRPILPIDETRYLSVAWEMSWRGDFLVSHMSGHTYSHKPPLLFWLINAVWCVVGELETAARLVAPTAGLVCLLLVRFVARGFWPEDSKTAWLTPVLMAATFGWCIFLPMTMFDTLVTLSLLICVLGFQNVHRRSSIAGWFNLGWLIVGLGVGLGLLAKGPVVLLFAIPGSIGFAWLKLSDIAANQRKRFFARWTASTLLAILLGAAIVLSWAIPSAMAGGSEYAHDLFFGQTAGRMVKSFAHKRPIYWYLPFLPLATLPWIAFRPTWSFLRVAKSDRTIKMLLGWVACTFTLFSLVSGKQLHYLLPLVPLWTLVVAKTLSVQSEKQSASRLDVLPVAICTFASMMLPILLDNVPAFSAQGLSGLLASWTILAFGIIGVVLALAPAKTIANQVALVAFTSVMWSCTFLAGTTSYWKGCDLAGLAKEVSKHEGVPVVWFGDNQAQLNFLGRIRDIGQATDNADLAKQLEGVNEAWVVYPAAKVRRSADSPRAGERSITPKDQDKANEIAQQLLKNTNHSGELTFLFTRNRELYTEDYFLFHVIRK